MKESSGRRWKLETPQLDMAPGSGTEILQTEWKEPRNHYNRKMYTPAWGFKMLTNYAATCGTTCNKTYLGEKVHIIQMTLKNSCYTALKKASIFDRTWTFKLLNFFVLVSYLLWIFFFCKLCLLLYLCLPNSLSCNIKPGTFLNIVTIESVFRLWFLFLLIRLLKKRHKQ